MRNTKWIYKESNGNFEKNRFYSKDLLTILENRGIKTENEIEKFLDGDIEDLRNPFDLTDMEKAIDIIFSYKKQNKKIWIYGDYDVDGITSTSLLYRAFHEIGIDCEYYIPLRDEGYGLNKDAIEKIKELGGELILTVDCGISSIDEVDFANSIGVEMIITDHHEINSDLPKASAVINVKRDDNIYDFKGISGVGTAFMLVLAIYRKLGIEEKAYKYLDIVAIGTVADLVPLVEDNRIIVKKGLEQLRKTRWNGLSILLRKLYENYREKKYDTYDIGFIIAPIFNAAGRLEDAKKSVELLISEDNKACDIISYELIKQNDERKDIQSKILDFAVEEIEDNHLDRKGIIIVAREKLHSGVIGIVASKIVDKYYKPTIVIDIKEDEGVGVASCRSIEGFNIIEALNSVRDVFVKYGGHSGAAGFTIEIDKISELKERLEKYVNERLDEDNFLKPIKIDKDLRVEKISYGFLDEISKIEPFGFGNSTPVFSLKNCTFTNLRKIGKDQTHLMMNIIKNGVEIKNCVWWNSADLFNEINGASVVDIAFKLKMEIFRDKYQYKIFIEDIKFSETYDDKIKNQVLEDMDMYDTVYPIKTVFYTRKRIKEKLSFAYYEDKIYVKESKQIIGELDSTTSYLLSNLKDRFGYKFLCEVTEIEETDENFNIYIDIFRDYSFESFKIREGEIFKEIKENLIGNFEYNNYQKKILASIFREKKNVLTLYKENRGVGTIIKTIGLYYKTIGKKALLITDKKLAKDYIEKFIEVSKEHKSGYDFYIYLDRLDKNLPKNYLIFIDEDKKIDNIKVEKTVTDTFEIPKNIKIIESLEEVEDFKNFWSRKISIAKREYLKNNLKEKGIIFATKDILEIL